MNTWIVYYRMSEASFELFEKGFVEDLGTERERCVEFPLWRMAVKSAINLASNGWAATKPRILAVRP